MKNLFLMSSETKIYSYEKKEEFYLQIWLFKKILII